MFTKFHNNVHPIIVLSTYFFLGLAVVTASLFGIAYAAEAQVQSNCEARGGHIVSVYAGELTGRLGHHISQYNDECVGATK